MLATSPLSQPILGRLRPLSSQELPRVVDSTLMLTLRGRTSLCQHSQSLNLQMTSSASVRPRIINNLQQLNQEVMCKTTCSMYLRQINNSLLRRNPLNRKMMHSTISSQWQRTIRPLSNLNNNNSNPAAKWISSTASTPNSKMLSQHSRKPSRMLSRHSKICPVWTHSVP